MTTEPASALEPTLDDVLFQRVTTYKLLSRLYKVEVDQECYDLLKSMKYPARTGNSDVDEGYRDLVRYMSHAGSNVLTELAVDYVRTFIGHGNDGYSAAYPFESVYTSPKRLLMQGARDEVLVIYRAAGIDKSESWKEGEDHIALELEFMQILAQRALDALRAGNEDGAEAYLRQQCNFLDDHLVSWYPMMAGDMLKFAATDFYKGLAHLTSGFLHTDADLLHELLGDEKPAASADAPATGDLVDAGDYDLEG